MAFYYPQKTTLDMGPTQILPGTQYWNVDRELANNRGEDRLGLASERDQVATTSDLELRDRLLEQQWRSLDDRIAPTRLTVDAGSLVLMYFDLFHRGTRLNIDSERYMYKFWFARTTEPSARQQSTTVNYRVQDPWREVIVSKVGCWLGLPILERIANGEESRQENHSADREASRTQQAYLAAERDDECLIVQLFSGVESQRRAAQYGLVTQKELGLTAVERLHASEHPKERQCAMFLMGELCEITDTNLQLVKNRVVDDDDDEVRNAAIIALGKIKRRQKDSVSDVTHTPLSSALLHVLQNESSTASQRQLAYLSLLTR